MFEKGLVPTVLALISIILGSLQAWDSDAHTGGLLVMLLVSTAIALPAVTLQAPLKSSYVLAAFIVSFLLLIIARLISPVPLPGLFLVVLPAGISLLYTGILANRTESTAASRRSQS